MTSARSTRRSTGRRRRNQRNTPVVALLCITGILLVLLIVMIMLLGSKTRKETSAALERTTFYDGIYIENVHLGGMTQSQARETLTRILDSRTFDGSVIVAYGQQLWEISSEQIQVDYELDQALAQAYALGRSGETKADNLRTVEQLHTSPIHLSVSADIGQGALASAVADIAAQIDQPAKNAALIGYNQYQQEQNGIAVDQQLLIDTVLERFRTNELTQTVQVPTKIIEPQLTVAQLEKNYRRLSSFTSKATSDKTRNSNITLALNAINGTILKPGEEFSMNDTTGERSESKGYKPAGAIRNGVLIQELGGGVCQVSTALFNAVARADLKVTARKPHTWPSNYIEKGQDAMVDYPGSDFKFVNNTKGDLFISCWFNNETKEICAELYGLPVLEEGITIALRSEVLETIEQPQDVVKKNNALAPGSVEETRVGRTGYRVRCYKQYLQNGTLLREEKFCDSYYAPIAAIYSVGPTLPPVPVNPATTPNNPVVIPPYTNDNSEPVG